MEAGTNFDQGAHASVDRDLTFVGFEVLGSQLERRAFARTIGSNDAQAFSRSCFNETSLRL